MWYYMQESTRQGPLAQEDLERLAMERAIDRGTLVWREGMAEWQPAGETELRDRLSLPVPVGPQAVAVRSPGEEATYAALQAQKLQKWFTVWWVCSLVGIPLLFVLIGYGVLVAAGIFNLMLLHGLWKTVQDGHARTTPGKAVGFLFIPLFNLYWIFVAFYGLAQELNRVIAQENAPVAKTSEGLALAHCILICTAVIPLVNFAAAIAMPVVLFLNFKQLKDAGVGLLRARAA
jgi:hypothetical protein